MYVFITINIIYYNFCEGFNQTFDSAQKTSCYITATPPPSSHTPSTTKHIMSLERVHRLGSMLHATALVFQAALLHLLRVSEQSEFVDLKTAVTVAALRSFLMLPPKSVTATQKKLGVDPGIKGRIWVSAYTAPVSPETGVRDAMVRAIEGLKSPEMASEDIKVPDAVPVEAEWTGYRAGATKKELPPAIPESEKYAEMMKECRSPTTILYFHGGAYWLMDPATHRPGTKLLAKLTGGRCYSVRYRLAPQNPFPAALMDALASYLTLLYPPPGAFHEAVRPEHIVFAGDRYVRPFPHTTLFFFFFFFFPSRRTTCHPHNIPR